MTARRPILNRDWIFAVLLGIALLATYYSVLNGKPIWDDDGHLTRPELRSTTGFLRIWGSLGATQQYYPMTHSVFWIGYHLWGMRWPGYHLLNILLHLVSALLLVKIIRLLGLPGARFAAAVFALHPIQVESVAWMSELKNCLSGTFFLGAALAYLQFDVKRSPKLYAASLGLFLLGLLSKTAIAGFPAAMLILLWWKKGVRWKRDVLPLLPFFVCGIGLGLFTAWVEGRFVIGHEDIGYNYTFLERCLIAGRAFWFYIGKLLVPVNLLFFYPRWKISAFVWPQYLYPAGLLLVATGFFLLRRYSRVPLAALGYFLVMLFPALGFIHIFPFRYSFVADHFQYLAGIGLIVPLSCGITALLARLKKRTGGPEWTIPMLVIAGLAAMSAKQCRMYTDTETLYRTIIAGNPGCLMAYNNLGLEYQMTARFGEAVATFRKAIELDPADYAAYCNLGVVLMRTGKVTEAVIEFRQALDRKPDNAEARVDLGYVLLRQGLTMEAIGNFKAVLAANPRNLHALLNLGDAYTRLGRAEDALLCYQAALRLQPSDMTILNNLYTVFLRIGRPEDAIAAAARAQELSLASGREDLAREIGRNIDKIRELPGLATP